MTMFRLNRMSDTLKFICVSRDWFPYQCSLPRGKATRERRLTQSFGRAVFGESLSNANYG